MHNSKRRDFLVSLGATASVVASKERGAQSLFNRSDLPLSILPTFDIATIEKDQSYWLVVKKLYAVTPKVTHLENGYWGVMTEQVRLQFERNIERLNQENSHYARINFASAAEAARSEVASSIGALPQEIAFTRGATEAMQLL